MPAEPIVKLHYLDSLRGFAILGVLMVHVWYAMPNFDTIRFHSFFFKGQYGVQLFFLVSAFTLSNSLYQRQTNQSLSDFFLRRFFRIAPLFYAAIFYYSWQKMFSSSFSDFYVENPVLGYSLNLTFLHDLFPESIDSIVPGGWSIGVEFTFYLLVPLLFKKLNSCSTLFNAFTVVLFVNFLLARLVFPLNYFQTLNAGNHFLYFNFLNQLPVFLLGMFWFRATREPFKLEQLNKWSALLFLLAISIQLCISNAWLIPEHLVFSILFLVVCIYIQKVFVRVLVNPITIFIGKISYSMYVIHFAIIFWFEHFHLFLHFTNHLFSLFLNYLIIIVVTIPLAWLSYQYLEIPFIKLGGKIIERRRILVH